MSSLPFDGRLYPAPVKKYRETIVFVHHFGGNRTTTKRHQDLVRDMGFDCVTFNVDANQIPDWKNPISNFKILFGKGWKIPWHVEWTNDLVEILNAISGPKILFTFSSLSVTALKAISEIRRPDVNGWICDGGPFLDMYQSLKRFYELQVGVAGWMNPVAAAASVAIFAGPGFIRKQRLWIKDFPRSVPILSIRSLNDSLVPESAIDKFFGDTAHLNFQKLRIEDADHLEGLRVHPEIYTPAVLDFLTKIATRI